MQQVAWDQSTFNKIASFYLFIYLFFGEAGRGENDV